MYKTPTIFNHAHDGHKLNLLTVKIACSRHKKRSVYSLLKSAQLPEIMTCAFGWLFRAVLVCADGSTPSSYSSSRTTTSSLRFGTSA